MKSCIEYATLFLYSNIQKVQRNLYNVYKCNFFFFIQKYQCGM